MSRCNNPAAGDYTGKKPSLGTCMLACPHYSGPERTPELIAKVLGVTVNGKPQRREGPPPAWMTCVHRDKSVLRVIEADADGRRICGGGAVHKCALHGECMMSCQNPPKGIRACRECADAKIASE